MDKNPFIKPKRRRIARPEPLPASAGLPGGAANPWSPEEETEEPPPAYEPPAEAGPENSIVTPPLPAYEELSDLHNVSWNKEQKIAIDLFRQGDNMFITGGAGTGKTLVVRYIKQMCEEENKICAITSTTGVSALLAGGVTIHSWGGIGTGSGTVAQLLKKIKKYPEPYWKRWFYTDVLVIDEISMMSPVLLDKLDKIAKSIRGSGMRGYYTRRKKLPFGGMQVIFVGDFCQLGPVSSKKFAFESDIWKNMAMDNGSVYLTQIVRQTDPVFQTCLKEIRLGIVTSETNRVMESCLIKHKPIPEEPPHGIVPTQLFPKNKNVDSINKREFKKLEEANQAIGIETVTYTSDKSVVNQNGVEITSITDKQRDFFYDKIDIASRLGNILKLTVGAQVMLTVNLDLNKGLANGSRGVVTQLGRNGPTVQFYNGAELPVTPFKWTLEMNDDRVVTKNHIPLRLAWAVTIHRCVNEDTLVYAKDGMYRIKELSSNEQENDSIETISLKVHGRDSIKDVSHIYKGIEEDSIRIETRHGFELEGSHRHPILTCDSDGNETWKKLPDIKIGDYIVLRSGTNAGTVSYIDTEAYMCPKKCIKKYTIPKYIDEDIAYVIGALIGDGSYRDNKDYTVDICGIDDDILEKYSRIMEDKFGVKCSVYKGKRTAKRYYYCSKYVRSFLLWCGLDYVTGEHKNIPWSIRQNNIECQKACLQGLFDTDGGISKTCVHYSTMSRQLAIDIQNMLLNLGIVSKRYIMKRNNKKYSHYKTAYRLQITEYYAHLYYNIIGFSCKRKMKDLKEKYGTYKSAVINSNIMEIPNGQQIMTDLRNEMLEAAGCTKRLNMLPKKPVGVMVSKIINGKTKLRIPHIVCLNEYIDLSEYETGRRLKNLLDNNIFYEPVTCISHGKCKMYDITVPDGHDFIANGVVNHNCQGATIDCVYADLGGGVFTDGQSYTALSRVKTLGGLYLHKWSPVKATCNDRVYNFYKKLEERQNEAAGVDEETVTSEEETYE